MRRVGALVVALLRDWWRNREAVFFALIFPVVMLVIFSTVFASGAAEFTVHVQNNDVGADGDATNLSRTFVDSLNDTDPITVATVPAGRNLTEWNQGNGSGSARILVIPDGFADRVRTQSGRVRISVIADTIRRVQGQMNDSQQQAAQRGLGRLQDARNATNGTGAATIRFLAPPDDQTASAVRGIIQSVVAGFNNRAIGVEEPTVTIETGEVGSSGLSAVDYFLPAFITMVIVINGLITVTGTIAGFNADGTLKRLAATPIRKRDWIIANVIQQSLLALLLTVIMLVVAATVFGVTVVPGPLAIGLLLVGAVAFSAVGITLGSLLEDPDAATSLGNAIAFPLMFLSGVFWQLELMPEFLRSLATVLPLYHFHVGLRQLMIVDSMEGVPLAFASLGLLAVVFVALGVSLTDWREFD